LEEVLDIKTLEIDTKIDVERFDEEVEVDDETRDDINRVFRVRKNIDGDNLESYRFWYYQLIQMYKHIFGDTIFECVYLQKNKSTYYSYTINETNFNIIKIN